MRAAVCGCRDDFAKAADYFRMAADAYAKAYGPSDRRMAEASKRAKAMAEKLDTRPVTATSRSTRGSGAANGAGTGKR